MKITKIAILLSVLPAACGSSSNLGSGFEIVDGGGSKLSLAKDGNILINYTVTGTGRVREYVIIESKRQDSTYCQYYLIDPRRRELVELSAARAAVGDVNQAIRTVEPINRRSCRNAE